MAEFILVDFGASRRDQIVGAASPLKPHAFPEQRAAAAFGEAAGTDAAFAMLLFMRRIQDVCRRAASFGQVM